MYLFTLLFWRFIFLRGFKIGEWSVVHLYNYLRSESSVIILSLNIQSLAKRWLVNHQIGRKEFLMSSKRINFQRKIYFPFEIHNTKLWTDNIFPVPFLHFDNFLRKKKNLGMHRKFLNWLNGLTTGQPAKLLILFYFIWYCMPKHGLVQW